MTRWQAQQNRNKRCPDSVATTTEAGMYPRRKRQAVPLAGRHTMGPLMPNVSAFTSILFHATQSKDAGHVSSTPTQELHQIGKPRHKESTLPRTPRFSCQNLVKATRSEFVLPLSRSRAYARTPRLFPASVAAAKQQVSVLTSRLVRTKSK